MNKQKDFGKGWRDYKTKRKQQTEEIIGIIQKSVGGCARNWASLIAEELIKYYQPKISENAVVLTREELKAHDKALAEKFARKAKELFFGVNCVDIYEWNWYHDKLDEICKEITEGV